MPIYFDVSSHELPLAVDSIGNRWNQESIKRPKGYPHYHWLQTEQGTGNIVIDKKELCLPQGAGVFIAPFVPHAYYPAESRVWITSFVTFCGKLEADISKIAGNSRYIPVSGSTSDGFSFQDWIDRVIASHESQQITPVPLSVDCYAFLMHLNDFRDYQDYLNHPLYQRYVAPALNIIETQYHQDITVQALADTVYISPQYLTRLFRRFLGCSTYTCLTNHRLVKAKELLVNHPELAVSQISFRTGYHDISHFIVMFKGATGYTPSEFRQLHL